MHEERLIPPRTPSASGAGRGDALDDLSVCESEERFRLAFEGAFVGMALVGLDGRFLRVNAALCRIVGYRADELVGMMFRDITHPDDVELDVALADKLARGEIASCQLEKRYVRKDSSVADVVLRASLLRRTSGEPLYFLAQIDDVTAQKRAEAERRRAEAEREKTTKELERLHAEWSSVVAHDLRQPLHTMSLYTQFLLRKPLDETARHAVERMTRSCSRLNRMIGDLMDLSRLDARRLELCLCEVDLCELVRESHRRFMMEAPERGVDLRVRGKVLPVDADPDRLAQILENLLSNALKYSTPGTPIEIAIDGTNEEVAVSVTNEGEGIAASEIPLLFQRFQRTPGAKATKIKGVGLGLYITNELVEAHGGRLEVESTPGAKTTFRFTLPVHR